MEKVYVVIDKGSCETPYTCKRVFKTKELAEEFVYNTIVNDSGIIWCKSSPLYKEMANEFFGIHERNVWDTLEFPKKDTTTEV